jgi:hypothetical protein
MGSLQDELKPRRDKSILRDVVCTTGTAASTDAYDTVDWTPDGASQGAPGYDYGYWMHPVSVSRGDCYWRQVGSRQGVAVGGFVR